MKREQKKLIGSQLQAIFDYVVDESGYGDHVWSEFKTDIYPTCTTAGQKSKYCTECGIQGEIAVIDRVK